MSDKRLMFLEKITQEGSTDPMAWYGLAMEYKSRERFADARRTFEHLRVASPDYVPMYLLCAEMLQKQSEEAKGDDAEALLANARDWLTSGIAAAKKAGNTHALGELQSALALLP
jgi:predicted Zn-dependent protease